MKSIDISQLKNDNCTFLVVGGYDAEEATFHWVSDAVIESRYFSQIIDFSSLLYST